MSRTEIQNKIYQYLARSAGTGNVPSDFVFDKFLSWIDDREATIADFRVVGGEWLVDSLRDRAGVIGWEAVCNE